MGWAWKTGTPRERANMVRSHRRFAPDVVRDVFALTENGLCAILGGADWCPEFSTAENHMSRIAEAHSPETYGGQPGFKESSTSRQAAIVVAGGAAAVREQVYAAIAGAGERGLTADEAAAAVGRKPAYVRPRVTELGKASRIVPTGARRPNVGTGLSAKVWGAKL